MALEIPFWEKIELQLHLLRPLAMQPGHKIIIYLHFLLIVIFLDHVVRICNILLLFVITSV